MIFGGYLLFSGFFGFRPVGCGFPPLAGLNEIRPALFPPGLNEIRPEGETSLVRESGRAHRRCGPRGPLTSWGLVLD